MVFDYMDHDLTGLMDRLNHKLPVREVTHLMPLNPTAVIRNLCRSGVQAITCHIGQEHTLPP